KTRPPKRAGGRTAVTVASLPWRRGESTSAAGATLQTPSPEGIRKGSRPRRGARGLSRPPVIVGTPVSIKWARQAPRLGRRRGQAEQVAGAQVHGEAAV